MNQARILFTAALFAALLGRGEALASLTVLNSPHNLSASGGLGKNVVRFVEEQRVCVFCHAPHNANAAGPLWGRDVGRDQGYQPYDSTTLKANPKPDKPTGSSRLCLSCHDGAIALGNFVGSTITSTSTMPWSADPASNPNLSTDLSNDHPISFPYTDASANAHGELAPPSTLPPQIRLERGGILQCTSCHDPHNNEFGSFLVLDNRASGSPLCVACHKKGGWNVAAHNPANSPELASGCMNCHYAHNAPQPARLLKQVAEEQGCLASCHNSAASPRLNLQGVFSPAVYRHPLEETTGVHDPREQLPAQVRHVECVDCHNPHLANGADTPLSAPPRVNGPLAGVRMDVTGATATKEYQVCFKCHSGGSANKFSSVNESSPNRRVIQEPDQERRFEAGNPSFHPVTAQRRGTGASLATELQSGMLQVYCSDCHNSDESARAGGTGPNGPHGSRYRHILMLRYDMPLFQDPRPPYSASLYDLCFRCHAESYVMGNGSAFNDNGDNMHDMHVREERVPCFACHDPHGVSIRSVPAATAANNAHLINLNLNYAANAEVPSPFYVTNSPGTGSCTVRCHSTGDRTRTYEP